MISGPSAAILTAEGILRRGIFATDGAKLT